MSHVHFPSILSEESRLDRDISTISKVDDHSADMLLGSATTWLRMPREGTWLLPSSCHSLTTSRLAPSRFSLKSSGTLRILSLILHLTLVAIHLALFVIRQRGLEHRLIFSSSLDTQKIVSFSITAIATGFGTVRPSLCCSLLLIWPI
jgi:hypothetical protein